ncbi:MAG: sulfate adenylyltransferase [Thermoproteota archaeon]|nr:MAG: sulfate adenylyltransferase [Candidatus Korarchaeota archaeon]
MNCVVRGRRRLRLLEEAGELPRVELSQEEAADVENLAYGVYSPLEGFMASEELESTLADMRLPSDVPWTIPILLDVDESTVEELREGDYIALCAGKPIALMRVEEVYKHSKEDIALRVYRTSSLEHPGVARVMQMRDFLLAGRVELISDPPNPYERYTLRPAETRVLFRERGWRTIAGFQTRNAPHLGHEWIQKTALAFVDGVFINPVIGRKKRGDFRDEVILAAYSELIEHYYNPNTVVLSILRYEMKYAGPREAVHHAIMRKNFGCTHFIVGRDHAGVAGFYKPYEAQEIFKEFPDLGITPLFFREFFYCRRCGGIANEKTCPHPEEERLRFSGTMIRKIIEGGERPPEYVMRPEVADTILSFKEPFVGG